MISGFNHAEIIVDELIIDTVYVTDIPKDVLDNAKLLMIEVISDNGSTRLSTILNRIVVPSALQTPSLLFNGKVSLGLADFLIMIYYDEDMKSVVMKYSMSR